MERHTRGVNAPINKARRRFSHKKIYMIEINKDKAMAKLGAEVGTALQALANEMIAQMFAQEGKRLTATLKLEWEPMPIDKTDWLSMARTHLPLRVALKDYRSMSVELYAMEAVGLYWQRYFPSVDQMARTLGVILNGYVNVRTLRNRMSDLDPQGRNEEKVEKALAFWRKMTQK